MHTCRQQHAPRSLTAPVTEIQHEAVVIPRAPDDDAVSHLDARIRRELATTDVVELRRGAAVVTEQAADPRCRQVALVPGVDDECAPPGPAEHQRGAQAGRAAADDHAIPRIRHATRLQVAARFANIFCHAGKR